MQRDLDWKPLLLVPALAALALPLVGSSSTWLTLTVAGQLCGVPVQGVRDILGPQAITPIPLAPPEVAGGLNLARAT